MEQSILTISIPTYNRNEELKNSVARLVPQLSSQVQLRVYDNCSDIPASETLKEFLHLPNVEVIRHVTNIGGDANIMRCYEQCPTPWGWVLGDDDTPHENAIATILAAIAAHPDIVFINFNSNLCRPEEYRREDAIVQGQSEFIHGLTSFSNLLFISTNVYKMAEIKKSLRNAYRFISSFSAQITLILDYLYDSDAKVLFSSREIVHWHHIEGEDIRPDSVINKSIPDVLSMVKKDEDRPVLYSKLSTFHPFPVISFRRLLHKQVFESTSSRNASSISYFQDQLFVKWVGDNLRKRNLLRNAGLMCLIVLINTPPVSTLLKPVFRRMMSNGEVRKRFREVRKFDIYRYLKGDMDFNDRP